MSTTVPMMCPCLVCSNGPVSIYHVGGPCPYLYPQPKTLADGLYRVINGELYRIVDEAAPVPKP